MLNKENSDFYLDNKIGFDTVDLYKDNLDKVMSIIENFEKIVSNMPYNACSGKARQEFEKAMKRWKSLSVAMAKDADRIKSIIDELSDSSTRLCKDMQDIKNYIM
jgi:hypothetical protein